jgi:hypothetical protein
MCSYKEEVHILILWVNMENETKHKILSWVDNVEFPTRNISSETIGFNICLLVMGKNCLSKVRSSTNVWWQVVLP